MAVLCGMPKMQYSARNTRLSVHKLFTSCIRRGLVSRDSIVDSDWLPATEWCQRYLPLSTYVGRHRKIGEVACTECTDQENDFELIPTVKMKTKNPIKGYFGSEFLATCNHCGVMAAWNRKTLKILKRNFWFFFFGKTTSFINSFKILFRTFSSRRR